jgi:hypothetical protein
MLIAFLVFVGDICMQCSTALEYNRTAKPRKRRDSFVIGNVVLSKALIQLIHPVLSSHDRDSVEDRHKTVHQGRGLDLIAEVEWLALLANSEWLAL